MNLRIGVFHATLNAVAPVIAEFQAADPSASLLHCVDEGLLPAMQRRGLDGAVMTRLSGWLLQMCEDGVDALLMTCSSATPLAPALREILPRPLVAIDEVMIAEALSLGGRLGVVATVPTAAETTRSLLERAASAQRRRLQVVTEVAQEAFARLQAGDHAAHDRAVRSATLALAEGVDAVLLAQVSMSRALGPDFSCPVPVLTSSRGAIKRTLALARSRKSAA